MFKHASCELPTATNALCMESKRINWRLRCKRLLSFRISVFHLPLSFWRHLVFQTRHVSTTFSDGTEQDWLRLWRFIDWHAAKRRVVLGQTCHRWWKMDLYVRRKWSWKQSCECAESVAKTGSHPMKALIFVLLGLQRDNLFWSIFQPPKKNGKQVLQKTQYGHLRKTADFGKTKRYHVTLRQRKITCCKINLEA